MEYVAAILAALWKVLAPFFAPAAGAAVGAELEKGEQAKDALDHIDEADKAVAAARGWSAADRLRYLQQRGRVRDIS